MIEDREELMSHTWPELRRFCRERHLEFTEVDLRWGITEEQAERNETLAICLDEIRRCHPFFIGLLGERYGWVPGPSALSSGLGEIDWAENMPDNWGDRSVTELEILEGVLGAPESARRAFFYFREAAYSQARGASFQADTPVEAQKQADLKARIRAACALHRIPLNDGYRNPRELAQLIRRQLEAAIESEFPASEIPDDLARSRWDHEAFAERYCSTFVGREDSMSTLHLHAEADGPPVVITGEGGMGKSALIANWVDRRRISHPSDFIIEHYVGAASDSANYLRLIARIIGEIKRWTGHLGDVTTVREDLLRDFPDWLSRARVKAERDGVNCFVLFRWS